MTIAMTPAETIKLRSIDREVARALARMAKGKNADLVGQTAALISYQLSQGDSCVVLEQWSETPFPLPFGEQKPLPSLQDWVTLLKQSNLLSDGAQPAAFVLDDQNLLYFYRYWKAETRVATFINNRLAEEEPGTQLDHQTMIKVFPDLGTEIDWQATATLAAIQHGFSLITGGPGTGKTTTVVRLLALLLHLNPDARIGLAAPTGKAAARLNQSIQGQVASLNLGQLGLGIPKEVHTLHRLLGYMPYRDQFAFNEKKLLPYDVVIIDEASMVDLLLMEATMAAIPHNARLILLGDANQLASVETGFILGDILAATDNQEVFDPVFAETVRHLTGFSLPVKEGEANPLNNAVVRLKKSYRFGSSSGIGALSAAIRKKNGSQAITILDDPKYEDVHRLSMREPPAQILRVIKPEILMYCDAPTPEEALVRFNMTQILCGLRLGPWGVKGMNMIVEKWLRRHGRISHEPYYRGRPLLITANDYRHGLFNGDIGICWPDGPLERVLFDTGKEELLSLSPHQLPSHETAWAMTIHKNQGSEFDKVLMILPESGSPLCNRELFYTGITRAKRKIYLVAQSQAILQACQKGSQRVSGLAAKLRNSA